MPNNFFKKIAQIIKAEKRIFLVLVFLVATFFINRELYSGEKITSEECSGGKCLEITDDQPQLTKDDAYYYADDLFRDQSPGYYRMTFLEKSSQAEKVFLKLSTYTEKEQLIGELDLSASDVFKKQEILFFLPEGYSSLLLQKENAEGEADIFFQEIGITKLNVDSQEELARMQKTILSEGAKIDIVRAEQSERDYAFSWLREKKTVLGQIFRASDDLITAVQLDVNINKNLDPGSRQYVLSLRKVNYDGSSIAFSGPVISSLEFSVKGIEKYREKDGTFLFPIYGKLERGEHYAFMLDNSRVSVSGQNYLELRGTRNNKSYTDGTVMVRKGSVYYPFDGDLFFKVYGAEFWQENGVKILSGAKIEDSGKGLGKYAYVTKNSFRDLLDLENASPGVIFSESAGSIVAPAKDETQYFYVVNTIYPVEKMNFFARQIKPEWKKVKVSYSFDQKDWIDLAYSEKVEASSELDVIAEMSSQGEGAGSETASEEETVSETDESSELDNEKVSLNNLPVQIFDAEIIPKKETRTIYFRVTYDATDPGNSRNFALKDLKITADLKMQPETLSR